MSHLHIPDGVLPLWLWACGWIAATLVLALGLRVQRRRPIQRIAVEGALTALMLVAMAVELPMGPLEYHLTLAGPVGVLLGAAGAFQAAFIASALLSFVGHGGFTVIGLNALMLGAVAAMAGFLYRRFRRRWSAGPALGVATGIAQLFGGSLWGVLLWAGIRAHATHAGTDNVHSAVLPALAIPLIVGGAVVEALVALGFGRFLERVRPDLLTPAGGSRESTASAPAFVEEPHVAAR
jgi:cobalt/nickel transport system permease protein